MVRGSRKPGLEVCIWFPLTFLWPALGYLATANFKGGWEMCSSSRLRKKKEGKGEDKSGEEIVCYCHTSAVFALILGESCIQQLFTEC